MIQYRKFTETLKSAAAECLPPKLPKAPKLASDTGARVAALGGLGALARSRTKNQNSALPLSPWTDAHEERAAVAEHDGGVPRAWAEGLARLDPANPPADVPARRWLRFIDDCGNFLNANWDVRAAALGWGPFDLFGCDRQRPFARIDHLGLLWLCDGGDVVELHRDRAILKSKGGAFQSYRRGSVEVGRVVLPWEIAS